MKSIIPLIVILLTACSAEVVTSHYPTLAAAQADRLFVRGWLPDLLPASSSNIRTANNLDLNTSKGEFFMPPSEVIGFIRNINTASKEKTKTGSVSKNKATATYTDGKYVWQFQCKISEGHCVYQLRPVRA